eukprot:RCo002625
MRVAAAFWCSSAVLPLILHLTTSPCLAVASSISPQPFLCDYSLAMQLRPFSCHGVVMRTIVDTLRAQYDANLTCNGEVSAPLNAACSLLPHLPPLRAPQAPVAVFFHLGLAPRYELAARRVYTALKHSGLLEVASFFVGVAAKPAQRQGWVPPHAPRGGPAPPRPPQVLTPPPLRRDS